MTFIVPVYNDASRLEKCLQAIRVQAPEAPEIELLVADNGSTDGSDEVARRGGATVFSLPNVSVSRLRNAAAARATGDTLAFVDSDNRITTGWIRAATDALGARGVAAVGAPYHAPGDGTWVQQTYGALRGRAEGQCDVAWIGSGNLVVRRAAFEQVGGFDEALETCEDVDLCRKLRQAGFRLLSDERLQNTHYGDPATLWQVFKGELWRGRDNLRVSFRRPWAWRTVATALAPLGQVALVAAALLMVLLGRPIGGWLVAVAAAALLPSAVKVVRRLRERSSASLLTVLQWFLVATVYDFGRALALVTRVPHRNRKYARKAECVS
jgi:glycosyltransferase involved in cell wall biosynthesis